MIFICLWCSLFPLKILCFNLGSINTHVIIKITAINETVKGEHRLQNNSLGEKGRKKSWLHWEHRVRTAWRERSAGRPVSEPYSRVTQEQPGLHELLYQTKGERGRESEEEERKPCRRPSPVQIWDCINSITWGCWEDQDGEKRADAGTERCIFIGWFDDQWDDVKWKAHEFLTQNGKPMKGEAEGADK